MTVSRLTALVALSCLLLSAAPVGAQQVAAGSAHSVALTSTGVVWTWGSNSNGQLGIGNTTSKSSPVQVTTLTNVLAIAAGGQSTYALKNDGTVWAWGLNSSGQLGDNSTMQRTSPVQVSGLTGVVAIAAGSAHALALKSNGQVWAWGGNTAGQIGDNTTTQRKVPVQVTALGTLATSIAAADLHSHATKNDGTAWGWGRNSGAETGNGTVVTPQKLPVASGSMNTMVKVAAGYVHAFAWDNTNAVRAWGTNTSGQLGLGNTTSPQSSPTVSASLAGTIALAGGADHTVLVKTGGAVWTTGANANGQLGNGTTTAQSTATAIAGLDSVVRVAAGTSFSIAVSSDGRVWTWGLNASNQLGDGTPTPRLTPMQISDPGFAWRVAVPQIAPHGGTFSTTQTVTITDATAGATIRYTTTGVDPTATDTSIASGGTLSIAQTTTLKVKAFLAGQPPSSVSTAVFDFPVATPTITPGTGTYATAQTVTLATTTSGATIRYTLDGSTPTAGSLLYAAPLSITTGLTLKAVALKTGWTTSGVATASYTFNYGTLAAPVFAPVPGNYTTGQTVTITAAAGATIRYTTDGSTPTAASTVYSAPFTLTASTTILAKAFRADWTPSAQAGGAYTLKVATPTFTPDAGTYAPGQVITVAVATAGATIRYTTNGLDPTASDLSIPSGGTILADPFTLKARAFLAGVADSDVKAAVYTVSGPFPGAVAAGQSHSVVLTAAGAVYTWGFNGLGNLGRTGAASLPNPVPGMTGVVSIAAGDNHTLAVKNDGRVFAWGHNLWGQLGSGTTQQNSPIEVPILTGITAVAAAANFSVALMNNGTVWVWGANDGGQLAMTPVDLYGTTIPHSTPTQVAGLFDVVAIAAGGTADVNGGKGFVLVRKADGTTWGWGQNALGQLGLGHTIATVTVPTQLPMAGAARHGGGSLHAFGARSDGSLWAWGYNNLGQLGLGTSGGPVLTPTLVSGVSGVRTVRGGPAVSFAIKTDGSVASWGNNGGLLGYPAATRQETPAAIGGLAGIVDLASGGLHVVALAADGTVWAWGSRNSGQLGDGQGSPAPPAITPIKVSEPGFAWKTGLPYFNPFTSTFNAPVTVALGSSGPPTVTFRYTTNGADPTTADTEAVGGSVTISQTTYLKVRAWSTGAAPSNVADATYTMQLATPTLSASPAGSGGVWTTPPTVTISLVPAVVGAELRYTTDGSDPTQASPVAPSQLQITATTTLKVRAFKAGWSASPIATAAYTMKVATPTLSPSGGAYPTSQTVTVNTSSPGITVRYTTDGTEPTLASPEYTAPVAVTSTSTLKATGWRTGWTSSDSAMGSYWITVGTVAAPAISPAGGAFTTSPWVTMSTTTSGATIRFTLDGSTPTESSPLYGWPLLIPATTTVKARAFKSGMAASPVATASLAVDAVGAVATPSIVPAGGWFASKRTVTVTSADPAAVLHYTTTGVDPVDSDPIITSGNTLFVDRAQILKVKAWKSGATPSAVRRADFVIAGALAASVNDSYALKADGTVWAWGDNAMGQVGIGSAASMVMTPAQVSELSNVVTAIAAGARHALAVKSDGTVWAWGSNSFGQLGNNGVGTLQSVPVQVQGLTGITIVAVAAGNSHSLALASDGRVFAWGANYQGQLGIGTFTGTSNIAVVVPGLMGVSKIAAGLDYSLAIESDGTSGGVLWAWGANDQGQLGGGNQVYRASPSLVPNLTQVIGVTAGQDFTLALRADRTLWSWGSNGSGQLGSGTLTNRFTAALVPSLTPAVALTAGRWNAGVLATDGRVWNWGGNGWSELGDILQPSPRKVPLPLSGSPGLSVGLLFTMGDRHSLLVQPNGTLLSWGFNGWGQLGIGNQIPGNAPAPVGTFTLADNTALLADPDGDRLPTWREYLEGTDPLNWDTAGTGLGDFNLVVAGSSGANTDADGDGISNAAERAAGTDPFNADSDGDGYSDGSDAFPLDPSRWQPPAPTPGDTTPPVITLTEPTNAIPLP